MEIFCLDLTLFRLVAPRLGGPGFLIHDSHLSTAVWTAAGGGTLSSRAAAGQNLQYIVTMNSDIFDRLPLGEEIDREKVVLSTRLSDETESGGLFGFRFD
jgi:uncharacterized protein YydD (DUF2326 family)